MNLKHEVRTLIISEKISIASNIDRTDKSEYCGRGCEQLSYTEGDNIPKCELFQQYLIEVDDEPCRCLACRKWGG